MLFYPLENEDSAFLFRKGIPVFANELESEFFRRWQTVRKLFVGRKFVQNDEAVRTNERNRPFEYLWHVGGSARNYEIESRSHAGNFYRVFRPSPNRSDTGKSEFGNEVVAGFGFFRNRIEKDDFEFRHENFQRDSRKTASGSDIENAPRRGFEIQKRGTVGEMLGNHSFPVADRGKVCVRIVREKKVGKTLEKRRLFGRRLNILLLENFFYHGDGNYFSTTDTTQEECDTTVAFFLEAKASVTQSWSTG